MKQILKTWVGFDQIGGYRQFRKPNHDGDFGDRRSLNHPSLSESSLQKQKEAALKKSEHLGGQPIYFIV